MQLSTGEVTFAASIIILAILILWIIPKIQVSHLKELEAPERFKIENEARKVIAEIIGGTVVLVGLFFTWQTVKSTGDNLKISQEGQITERFTRAIEQLGKADNIAIRLGGIRGLERLAADSTEDHWAILKILCVYIRQNVPLKEEEKSYPLEQVSPPPLDIQAILDILGRQPRKEELHKLILRGTDLRRADLTNGNFRNADFTKAHLGGALLSGIHLEKADLIGANLTRAILKDAHLEGADLTGAILDDTELIGVNLRGVKGLTREQIQFAKTDSTTQLPWSP